MTAVLLSQGGAAEGASPRTPDARTRVSANRRAKEAEVADLAARLRAATLIALADFQGISVEEATRLRRGVRAVGGRFAVHKNTLVRIAVREAGLPAVDEALVGNTGLATVVPGDGGDPVAAAKAIVEFSKGVEKFRVKTAFFEGKVLPLARFKELADLPSREQLIVRLIGAIQAPLRGIASVVAAPLRGLATVIDQASKKIQQASKKIQEG